MRLVIDTNVLVSGLLNGGGAPGKVVGMVLAGTIMVIHSPAILAEYREVLGRPKFPFSPDDVASLIETIAETGEWVQPETSNFPLPDEKDRPFIDAARVANCPVVTGNARHFPADAGAEILSPAACVERLLKG
jgi:putative PIN family toxin of toxin-antitoxin system